MNRYPDIGALIGAKYRLVATLGVGGMGAVFRARNELIDKEVALKVLSPRSESDPLARDRFLREARFAARIRHPNVVEVYDVGIHDERSSFLVMELLEGETLASILERGDAPLQDVLRWLCEGMRGVAVAHRMGVIHRDVKPENLFVTRDEHHPQGLTKVLDFGISKSVGDPLLLAQITATGAALGTPTYMSMEQLNGVADLDVRTDVYSFGVLLYRALTGRLPFQHRSLPSLALAIYTETPPAPRELCPELPAELADIASKAMARDREQRYATINELIDALSPWLVRADSLTTHQRAASSSHYPTPESLSALEVRATSTFTGRRRKAVWWSALGVIAVLSTLGIWLAGDRRAPTETTQRGAAVPPEAPPPAAAEPAPPPTSTAPAAASQAQPAPAAAAQAQPAPASTREPTRKRASTARLEAQQRLREPALPQRDPSAPARGPDQAGPAPPTPVVEPGDANPSRSAAGKRSGTLRADEL
jgi:serine/threonine-protein kinase